ncbi:MAG TPA: hypothetical protein VHK47_11765 [Polyangia bacterium]|jgi:hypothetical protein|nr:hypothetical protein [Polyangia bacterium]
MSTIAKMGRVGSSLAAAAFGVALAGPALAEDVVPYASPDDPAAAEQAKADAARQRADKYAAQGGWAYKSGTVRRADAEANRMQAKADAIRAQSSGVEAPAPSPELQAAEARVKLLRDTGGPAYKSGEVDRAQTKALELSQPVFVEPSGPGQVPPNWDKPAIQEGQEKMAPSQPDE